MALCPTILDGCDIMRRSLRVPSQRTQNRIELMTPLRSFDDSLLLFPNSRTDQSIAPVFSLARRGDLLFFVNHSDRVLDYVSSEASGALATGDGGMTFADGGRYNYPDVRPREAVLLDEYDGLAAAIASVPVPSLTLETFRSILADSFDDDLLDDGAVTKSYAEILEL